ncbi:peptidoglycan D,D-transpeptidase FtsI family protein [Nesterenkonia natronophila]|uniref:Penicillin-binding protein 2 n=1 Tax=Nesterenkonia natronophila TaxID=2174932 RepID=A0A3A4F5P7_9MICC|nr:penicillin-binding protein 2 [Nesterenkonia natronophila]RJN33081.1 penicillin-binding protein 2 [Nesterenkonia natronophila]
MARTLSLRMRIGLAIVLALLVVLGGRLFHIQGLDPAGHAHQAVSNRLHTVELPAARGDIVDTQGRLLAGSADRYDIVADPRLTGDHTVPDAELGMQRPVTVEQTAEELALLLDADSAELLEQLTADDTHYATLARNVTPEVHQRIMELRVPGVYSEPVSERTYPSGPVAGSIIGFVGSDGPLEGLESEADEALSGEPGERIYEVGADGVRIPTATYEEVPAEDGQDVRLTIDQDVQWFAQEAIADKTSEYNAQWGNATVVDLREGREGEILAMADSETVDPSDPAETDELFRRPLALTQDFEPGSGGKSVTFAAALEEGLVEPESEFTVPYRMSVNGESIQNARSHADYEMTAAGIYARSYNTGTLMIGNRLEEQTRYDYLRKVGYGEPMDIGLGVEGQSILRPPEEWDRRQPLTTQFGQGYTGSVLHNVQLYQMLAQDGVKHPLRIVDAHLDPDGDEHPVSAESERIFSSETSQEMLKLMEGVVDYGSAMGAQIEGYRVGGKSGTAEAAGAAGGFDGYTVNFVGVAPLDDPQFVVSITVHRPAGEFGDWDLTNTFSDIMTHTLTSYDVAPSDAESGAYDGFVGQRQDYPW